jgi:Transglycosylase SLT domain
VSASAVKPSGALTIGAVGGAAVLSLVASLVSILSVLIGQSSCPGAQAQAVASANAEHGIPETYLTLYQRAGRQYAVPWQTLAGIGSIETDHGRSSAPGVRSGVNSYGCCAGPMQFNLRDGPPSTWDRYRVDGNRDGSTDVYDPADAISSAANYLRTLLRHAAGNLSQAVFGYNHSQAYVNDVLARARAYAGLTDSELAGPVGDPPVTTGCAGGGIDATAGPANMRAAERVDTPRAFRMLPAWAIAAGTGPAAVDARIYDNVVWIVRRYHLRVTAAREAGHRTHGDGTAIDLIPADGTTQPVWDASAGRLAHDLGWSPNCARSGTRPACRLAPAIQFIGYDRYPNHGSPRTCAGDCPAHLHISWASPCYGTGSLAPPCTWVTAFPTTPST